MIYTILVSAAIMLALGAIFALLLAFLGNKLKVKRDSRIDEVLSKLSGANCGGCGYAGCDAFATAVVEGKVKVSECPSTSKENKTAIAEIMGELGGDFEETVAVVNCGGGINSLDKYEYQGYGNCQTCELLAGGRKACPVGCMGLGSCVDACPYFAIDVGQNGYATVKKHKCVSCGACIKICPKNLISRIPKSAKVYIACSNDCKGKDVREICKKGCITCGICQKICPEKAIIIENGLPKIDYKKCSGCLACVKKCPTNAIAEHKNFE